MSGWQPIETAPKDGTAFLAYYPTLGAVRLIYRHDPGGAEKNPKHNYECWVQVTHNSLGSDWNNPTHWMPLPKPPKD